MQITAYFRDTRYVLAALAENERRYVALCNMDGPSWFLGRESEPLDLAPFWRKHEQDETYCIPCELMLVFDEQWISVPNELPLEMGIDTETAQMLIGALLDRMPIPDMVQKEWIESR